MESTKAGGWKRVILHEMGEYLWFLTYMALFFWIFATYRMLIQHDFHAASYEYATAFVNALVLSKAVLLGQQARVGTRHEHRSLIISSIYKSLLFALLVAVFHIVEEFLKELLHRKDFSEAFHELGNLNFPRLLVYTIVVFCVFIPFFAIWETRRVMGCEEFDRLFLHRGASKRSPAKVEAQIP